MRILNFAQNIVDPYFLPKNDLSNFNTVINIIYVIAGSIAVIVVIYAGIQLIISLGNSEKVAKARRTAIYAIVGLIVIALSYPIIGFIVNALT